MTFPLVSIIIPVYNRSVEFERALQSALAQDYPNIEVIVVDDGSEDDIQTVVQRNLDNSTFSILYHRQENKGVGGARQKGVQLSNGVYIQHLDADDTISPNKISSQVKALEENPSAVACICGAQDNLYSTDLLELSLNAVPWCTSDVLWRYPHKEIAKWPSFIGGSDIVHFINIGLHNQEIVWIKEKLTQIYPSQKSHSKVSKTGSKREQRLHDNYLFPIHIYTLLQWSKLISIKKYREPLAERFYRIAFQFAMISERKKALDLLKYAYRSTSMLKKKIEVIIAYSIIYLTRSKTPIFYIALFKIHRKINPKSLHADKYITTLI